MMMDVDYLKAKQEAQQNRVDNASAALWFFWYVFLEMIGFVTYFAVFMVIAGVSVERIADSTWILLGTAMIVNRFLLNAAADSIYWALATKFGRVPRKQAAIVGGDSFLSPYHVGNILVSAYLWFVPVTGLQPEWSATILAMGYLTLWVGYMWTASRRDAIRGQFRDEESKILREVTPDISDAARDEINLRLRTLKEQRKATIWI
ncbi:MAG: hypothetical protein RBU21_18075 [FCB group bacterium]|nr:hypothetical protein [FCB group bacterium]